MSPASGQEERRRINYGRGIACDAVIIITRIFPGPTRTKISRDAPLTRHTQQMPTYGKAMYGSQENLKS